MSKWLAGRSHDPARWQAMTAFGFLGTNIAPALPELRALATNSNRDVSSSAKFVLDQYEKELKKAASNAATPP
jgi:hypothetical protein